MTQLIACTVPRLVWAERRAAAAPEEAQQDDDATPNMWPALVVSAHEISSHESEEWGGRMRHDVQLTIRFLGLQEHESTVDVCARSVTPFACVVLC